ncbi:hypothetical protein NEAUS03_1790 [Nematocida ausubeli]|nr:hypothetical protein NEAUS03_1790 [Nematocida ausubeli]
MPSPTGALDEAAVVASKTPQGQLASAAVDVAAGVADATKDKKALAKDPKSANPNPKDEKAAIDSSK